jgi:F-type H+-transporting ATPase subunit b
MSMSALASSLATASSAAAAHVAAALPALLGTRGVLPVAASNGSFLIKPGIGLMVWTLLVFGVTMVLLSRLAFPRISAALERRQKTIEESIDTAERTRKEADALLAEYRQRLQEARGQADEIVQRARQAAETHEREAREQGRELATEAARRVERDIEAATHRALQEIRREVADLTIMATEKVTRKTLDAADQRRLVEEALGELDFSTLSAGADQN